MQTEQPQTPFIKPEQDEFTFQVGASPRGPLTRYYHAKEKDLVTPRRYSAAAQLLEDKEGKYLLIAYSVCSETDAFVKVVSRDKLDEKLRKGDGHKVYLQDDVDINKWGQHFLEFVKHIVPASTLTKNEGWIVLRDVQNRMKVDFPKQTLPTHPTNCYIQVKKKEMHPNKVQQLMSQMMQQAENNILGNNTKEMAQA